MAKSRQSFIPQFVFFNLYQLLFLFTIHDKENWVWTVFLILIVTLLDAFEIKRSKTYTSPLVLWYTFWLLMLTVARMDLKIYDFKSTWSDLLAYSIVLVNYGFFFSFIFGYSLKKAKVKSDEKFCETLLFFRCVIALQLIYIVSFGLNVAFTGMIPLISGDTDELKMVFAEGPFYKFVNISRVGYVLAPLVLKYSPQKRLKKITLILAVICLFCDLLSGWRGFMFQAIILFASSYFILFSSQNKKQSKKLKKQLLLLGVFSIGIIGYVGAKRAEEVGGLLFIFQFALLMIYMYSAPNFLNLQSAMQTVVPKGYPLYTAEAFWSLVVPPSEMKGFESINQNIGGFNVSTYLLQPWADGGVLGMVLVASIFGFIAGRALKNVGGDSIKYIVLLGTANVVIFTMHNGFMLRSSSCFIWLIIGWLLSYYSVKKNRNSNA